MRANAVTAERADTPEPLRAAGAIPPFQAFLDEHRDVVYRFLLASVGPNDADDCFQETFLAALRAYPKLRHGDNLKGWILAIATRKAIDSARASGRRPDPVPDVAIALGRRGQVRLSQEMDVMRLAFDDDLWNDVAALPPRQRVALVHRILLDRPYAELAAAMGSSVQAARANVYQALKKLKEAWGHERG